MRVYIVGCQQWHNQEWWKNFGNAHSAELCILHISLCSAYKAISAEMRFTVSNQEDDLDVSAPKLQILNRTHISNPTAHSARIIYTITAVSRWRPKISGTNSVSDQMSNMVTMSPSVPVLRLWIMTRKVFLLCRSEFDLWPFGYKLSWHHYYRLFKKKQHFLITRMWILEFKTQPLFTKLYPIVG